MSDTNKKSRKVTLSIILSIGLSIAVILLILYFTLDAKPFEALSAVHIRYEFFVAAVLINVLCWVIWGARLKILSNAIDPNVHISLWESTKIVIANLFFAGITPSLAGGEPVRIYLLNKDGLSTGGATAAVLGERLIDAIFLLLCLPFAVYIVKDYINVEFIKIGLYAGVIFFIICIFLLAYAIKYPEKIKTFLIFITEKLSRLSKKKTGKKSIVQWINHEVDNFHQSMVFFLTRRKKAFLQASLLTVLYWSLGFMIPSMIMLGLGLKPFFIESYAAQAILLVIVMMPLTPGSSGIAELFTAGLYAILIGPSLLGVFVILFRFITFHMNMIAGGIFQYRIFKSITSFSLDKLEKHQENPPE
ncbi:MAG: flippase-like domain-containing protein [Thermoplasmata archaeon]|nr:flippase-like domain-containing protein [Thermoplasmata archaeon]